MTPAEIGRLMTEAFGEERGREIVEAIVGLTFDDTMKAQREFAVRHFFQEQRVKAEIKKRWWHK